MATVFPLPCVEAFGSKLTCSGARGRRRFAQRCSRASLVNEAISALNWCAGAEEDGASRTPNATQQGSLSLLEEAVRFLDTSHASKQGELKQGLETSLKLLKEVAAGKETEAAVRISPTKVEEISCE